ncbi:Glutamate racemase [Burkholderiales bacterium 8X]|nr:Glutamate racemase [Burkholderiales bacterium 8X]
MSGSPVIVQGSLPSGSAQPPARVAAPAPARSTRIGVFDSGIGGLSVLDALLAELPASDFVYFADNGFAPYGERGDAFVLDRTLAIARHLVEAEGIGALVVACNSATAAAVHVVRETFAGLPVVGIEPALKPAVGFSKTGHVAVLATRMTVESRKFAALRDSLADRAAFHVVACDGLAGAIESADFAEIESLSARYVAAAGRFGSGPGQIDTLVLGCTHYPFIADTLRTFTGDDVRFVDTGLPVAQQTRRLLAAAGSSLPGVPTAGSLLLRCSGSTAAIEQAAGRWLKSGYHGQAQQVQVPAEGR